ncbi:nicotinamide mononucleotide transporter [Calothrix sp. HK-06]|nr:nicotinamide mononucleotide transporter [Calothrix sp. HK-06]
MLDFLSINNIAFEVIGYPMSYIEFIGTILYLWATWLVAKQKMLNWPVGIVSSVLYMVLFFQIRLYSDMLEQLYFIIVSVYGWWRWSTPLKDTGKVLRIKYSEWRRILLVAAITVGVAFALGALISRVHLLVPALFPEKASFPFLDALTTIMSFSAMWLMALKRLESWFYWIIVDGVGVWLYYVKGVKFVALLYVILLFLAVYGFMCWLREGEYEGKR